MRTIVLLFILGVLGAAPSFAQATCGPIDLATVQVVGADRGVLGFPVTARLETFRVEPGAMTLATTGTASWPSVAIDDSGTPVQSATLWIFLKIQGQWYATGAERLRPEQLNGTKPEAAGAGELATLVGSGWLWDASRWRPMAGYNPAFGEPVGVMVAAGSTRSDNNTPVHARTQVRCLSWPNGSTLWDEGQSAPPVTPSPTPPNPQQPPVVTPTMDPSGLFARIDLLQHQVEDGAERRYLDLKAEFKALREQLAAHDDHLTQHDKSPSWLASFLKSPLGIILTTAGSTCAATQCWSHLGGK